MSIAHTWTHAICPACYAEKEPGRKPVSVADFPGGERDPDEPCCWCGQPNKGIYYRAPAKGLRCQEGA